MCPVRNLPWAISKGYALIISALQCCFVLSAHSSSCTCVHKGEMFVYYGVLSTFTCTWFTIWTQNTYILFVSLRQRSAAGPRLSSNPFTVSQKARQIVSPRTQITPGPGSTNSIWLLESDDYSNGAVVEHCSKVFSSTIVWITRMSTWFLQNSSLQSTKLETITRKSKRLLLHKNISRRKLTNTEICLWFFVKNGEVVRV